eukprot:SAG31_NODE_3986_length_3684_cov_3.991074_2_plen_947_part_01
MYAPRNLGLIEKVSPCRAAEETARLESTLLGLIEAAQANDDSKVVGEAAAASQAQDAGTAAGFQDGTDAPEGLLDATMDTVAEMEAKVAKWKEQQVTLAALETEQAAADARAKERQDRKAAEEREKLLAKIAELEAAQNAAAADEKARVDAAVKLREQELAAQAAQKEAAAREDSAAQAVASDPDYNVSYVPTVTVPRGIPSLRQLAPGVIEVELVQQGSSGYGMNISPSANVVSCTPGGISHSAGVPVPSRITSVNGMPIDSKADVKSALQKSQAGVPVRFVFQIQEKNASQPQKSKAENAETKSNPWQMQGTILVPVPDCSGVAQNEVSPDFNRRVGSAAEAHDRDIEEDTTKMQLSLEGNRESAEAHDRDTQKDTTKMQPSLEESRESLDPHSRLTLCEMDRAIAEADEEMSADSDEDSETKPVKETAEQAAPLVDESTPDHTKNQASMKERRGATDTSEDDESMGTVTTRTSESKTDAATLHCLHQQEEKEVAAAMPLSKPAAELSRAEVVALHEVEENECKSNPSMNQVDVTFQKPGTLGLRFTQKGETVILSDIMPNTQAVRFSNRLSQGMELRVIQGVKFDGTKFQPIRYEVVKYSDAIQTLRTIGRPVTLSFDASHMITATVGGTAKGTRQLIEELYSKFNPEKLQDIDTLAAKYGEEELLRMVRKKYLTPRQEIDALYSQHNPEKLRDVDGLLAKYGEAELLRMVRKKYRNAAGTPSVPPPPPPVEKLTGQAAANALQQHLATHGTKDVQKITRLRRASMVQGTAGGQAAASVRAASRIQPSTATGPIDRGVTVRAVMSEKGPFGIRFARFQHAGSERMRVVNITPGSQASRHQQLKNELLLFSVKASNLGPQERRVTNYDIGLNLLKTATRPTELCFSTENVSTITSASAQPSRADLPISSGGAAKGTRQLIEELYSKFNPEKLQDIDTLAAKYGEE